MPTVLILGASRGIGLEFVRQYRAEGWRVIASARDDEGLARIAALGATSIPLDVTDASSIAGLAWRIDGETLDVALYVAGVISRGRATVPPTHEEFDRVMHTNVLGAMQIIPVVAPAVAKNRGTFVLLSSLLGSLASVDGSHTWLYRVSKAALNMVVRAAAFDYSGAILVAMSPGWVRTDMGGAGAPLTPEESVAAMRASIRKLGAEDTGALLRSDGTTLPW